MGLWQEYFHPKTILRWDVLSSLVAALIGVAGILVALDQFAASNVCFSIVAACLFAKVVSEAIQHRGEQVQVLLFAFVLCGFVGVGIVAAVRVVNHYRDSKNIVASQNHTDVAPQPTERSNADVVDSSTRPNDNAQANGRTALSGKEQDFKWEHPKPKPQKSVADQSTSQTTSIPVALQNQPPPPQDIRIVSQEWISSTRPEYKYDLKIILQTNVVIQPVSFLFICDGPIGEGDMMLAGEVRLMRMEVWDQVIKTVPNRYLMAYRSPAFTPEQNIVLNLFSNSPIKLTSFEHVPFPRN